MASVSAIYPKLCCRVLYLVALPFIITVFLGAIAGVYFDDRLPKMFDDRSSQRFFADLENWSVLRKNPQTLFTLAAFHVLQTLFCFPFVHITRTVYGHVFGFWRALVISFAWENIMVIVYGFVFAHCNQPAIPPFLNNLTEYVHTWRNGRFYTVFLVALQMSSIPFVTKFSLVAYSVVSHAEFLKSCVLASLLMCTKDTMFGDYIAHSGYSTSKLWTCSVFMGLSTLLPTLLTLSMIIAIIRFRANVSSQDTEEPVPESDQLLGDQASHTTSNCPGSPASLHSSVSTEITTTCADVHDGVRDTHADVELATMSPKAPTPPPRRDVRATKTASAADSRV